MEVSKIELSKCEDVLEFWTNSKKYGFNQTTFFQETFKDWYPKKMRFQTQITLFRRNEKTSKAMVELDIVEAIRKRIYSNEVE